MNKEHLYTIKTEWAGNMDCDTNSRDAYVSDQLIISANKSVIHGPSDPIFRGDGSKYNPEELLVASLSACHMHWYLHLCSRSGIVVTHYSDNACGTMVVSPDGGGFISEVTLRPIATIADGRDTARALQLHDDANKKCFIANSCRFPVHYEAVINAW